MRTAPINPVPINPVPITVDHDVVHAPPRPSRLARGIRIAAPLWAAGYGLAALGWTIAGSGYPFARDHSDYDLSLARWVPSEVGAPLLAGLLLVLAAVLAWTGRTPHPRPVARGLALGYGYGVAAVLAFALAGVFPLAVTGYAPMIPVLLLMRFGGMTWHDVLPYPGVNAYVCLLGGILVGLAVLGWQWRTRGRCERCGLRPGELPDRQRWAATGRWTVAVSVLIPLLYAITRLAWVVNVPLGISDEMLRDLHRSHGVWAGFGLGLFAVAGSLLTLGLVQRWGERFPAWIPGLGGRRVPIALAVVPAGLVAVLTVPAGLALTSSPQFMDALSGGEWAVAPSLLWPLWGPALGVATFAYLRRRQDRCPHLPD